MEGRAASVQTGATLVVRRALIVDNMEAAISSSASVPGTRVEVTDTIIGRTGESADGRHGGRGITVQDGASASVERVLFFDDGGTGVFVASGSSATLVDVEVREMRPDPDGRFGRGVTLQTGGALVADRVLLIDDRDTGLYASGPGTSAAVTDLTIRNISGRGSLIFGRGLDVFAGATLDGTRVVVDNVRDLGVHTAGATSRVSLIGALVSGVQAQECASTTCAEAPAGHGAGAYDGAELILEDFEISGAAFCGAHVGGGRVVLRVGSVVGSAIGACVQTDGYDLELLRDRVEYRDNGTNLDTTMLPTPDLNVDDAL